jgi:hypothetical protein
MLITGYYASTDTLKIIISNHIYRLSPSVFLETVCATMRSNKQSKTKTIASSHNRVFFEIVWNSSMWSYLSNVLVTGVISQPNKCCFCFGIKTFYWINGQLNYKMALHVSRTGGQSITFSQTSEKEHTQKKKHSPFNHVFIFSLKQSNYPNSLECSRKTTPCLLDTRTRCLEQMYSCLLAWNSNKKSGIGERQNIWLSERALEESVETEFVNSATKLGHKLPCKSSTRLPGTRWAIPKLLSFLLD